MPLSNSPKPQKKETHSPSKNWHWEDTIPKSKLEFWAKEAKEEHKSGDTVVLKNREEIKDFFDNLSKRDEYCQNPWFIKELDKLLERVVMTTLLITISTGNKTGRIE